MARPRCGRRRTACIRVAARHSVRTRAAWVGLSARRSGSSVHSTGSSTKPWRNTAPLWSSTMASVLPSAGRSTRPIICRNRPILLRRARQDAAADFRHVPALGEHHAVGNELDVAGCQPRERGIALGLRCRSVDVLGAHTGLDEFIPQMDRMRDVDGEGHRLPALAKLVPVRDDVADQFRPIHAVGKLGFDIVAGLDANACQIGIDRRIDAGLDQKSLLDQRRDLRAFDDGLEDPTESAPVAAAWRCRQAQEDSLGVALR